MEKVSFVNTKIRMLIEELLERGDQQTLALWAADCVERVVPYYLEKYPEDCRVRDAIEAGRAWVCGELTVPEAHEASLAAHAAVDEIHDFAARAVARAAGHVAATARDGTHAYHAAAYASKAAALAGSPEDAGPNTVRERTWQYYELVKRVT